MATMYKTPGVYVEEIPKFPPSIAPVETAIPAFIGYTEKAERFAANDLKLIPTRISSLAEYEKYFGTAQPEEKIKVKIDETQVNSQTTELNIVASVGFADTSKHLMYYAL